ncbi:hypothetical protein EYC84_010139 [Monilinia fructicola]|uniref:Uncharacterized protein n=1 Tax=Monilinia fructicola TaxID=38448 RepID=A0A5M9JCI5_MONFR|nr:hypothetical protein EYC84_010139 [Monilinia fructicola]
MKSSSFRYPIVDLKPKGIYVLTPVARPLDRRYVQKDLVLHLLYRQTFYRIDSTYLRYLLPPRPTLLSRSQILPSYRKAHSHNQPKGSSYRKTGPVPELPSHITSYDQHLDGLEPFSCHPKSNTTRPDTPPKSGGDANQAHPPNPNPNPKPNPNPNPSPRGTSPTLFAFASAMPFPVKASRACEVGVLSVAFGDISSHCAFALPSLSEMSGIFTLLHAANHHAEIPWQEHDKDESLIATPPLHESRAALRPRFHLLLVVAITLSGEREREREGDGAMARWLWMGCWDQRDTFPRQPINPDRTYGVCSALPPTREIVDSTHHFCTRFRRVAPHHGVSRHNYSTGTVGQGKARQGKARQGQVT